MFFAPLTLVPHVHALTHTHTHTHAHTHLCVNEHLIALAHVEGMLEKLLIPEVRPYNQGSRLTAYEAVTDGFGHKSYLSTDSSVASWFTANSVDACFVGADRVALNGDTANKIGTLQMAITAKHFR